jgi:biopolymer transport protein ExbD
MPKLKMPKSSPALDMTPMVDLAFLLVTFFMLTAQFRAEESVVVDTPSSQAQNILKDKDLMLLTIDSAGRIFFTIDGKEIRENTLKEMGKRYNIIFTDEQVQEFALGQGFGVPINILTKYLDAEDSDRKKMDELTKGIPFDTTLTLTNELYHWVDLSRRMSFDKSQSLGVKNGLRYAIKADGKSNYKIIKGVIKMFQTEQINVNRFNLITDLETGQEE